MARTIAIWGPTALATPTCKVMLRSTPTTVVETITLTEHGTVKRLYTGTVTLFFAAGDYYHNLLSAGSYVGGGTITVGATDATTYYEDFAASPAVVNTEVLDVLNVDTLIDGKTLVEASKYIAASAAGKLSGAGTGTEVLKGLDGTTTRITATVDASGNRTAITLG